MGIIKLIHQRKHYYITQLALAYMKARASWHITHFMGLYGSYESHHSFYGSLVLATHYATYER